MNFHIMNLWYLLEMVWEILQDDPDHETGTCKSSILQLTIIISQHDVQSVLQAVKSQGTSVQAAAISGPGEEVLPQHAA